MNKVFKISILVVSIVIITLFGLNMWLNYNAKKEALPVVLKTEVNWYVTRINNYCAVEEMKIQMGQSISSNCKDNNTILNKISNQLFPLLVYPALCQWREDKQGWMPPQKKRSFRCPPGHILVGNLGVS